MMESANQQLPLTPEQQQQPQQQQQQQPQHYQSIPQARVLNYGQYQHSPTHSPQPRQQPYYHTDFQHGYYYQQQQQQQQPRTYQQGYQFATATASHPQDERPYAYLPPYESEYEEAVSESESMVVLACIVFLVGFCFPLIWLVGLFFISSRFDRTTRNFGIASVLAFVLSFVVLLVFAMSSPYYIHGHS